MMSKLASARVGGKLQSPQVVIQLVEIGMRRIVADIEQRQAGFDKGHDSVHVAIGDGVAARTAGQPDDLRGSQRRMQARLDFRARQAGIAVRVEKRGFRRHHGPLAVDVQRASLGDDAADEAPRAQPICDGGRQPGVRVVPVEFVTPGVEVPSAAPSSPPPTRKLGPESRIQMSSTGMECS